MPFFVRRGRRRRRRSREKQKILPFLFDIRVTIIYYYIIDENARRTALKSLPQAIFWRSLRQNSRLPRRLPLLPSPWGRWRGAVPWHCTATDEGSPLTAGLTSARTLTNSVHGAGAPLAPLCKVRTAANLSMARQRPRLPLRRELAFAFASGKSKRLRERIPDQLTLCHLG